MTVGKNDRKKNRMRKTHTHTQPNRIYQNLKTSNCWTALYKFISSVSHWVCSFACSIYANLISSSFSSSFHEQNDCLTLVLKWLIKSILFRPDGNQIIFRRNYQFFFFFGYLLISSTFYEWVWIFFLHTIKDLLER